MHENIEVVFSPIKVINDSTVPEFGIKVGENIAVIVGQGRMESSEEVPLRTDGVGKCQVLLLKTSQVPNARLYTLNHLWGGDSGHNLPGARWEDIQTLCKNPTTAFFVTGDKDSYLIEAEGLAQLGVTVTKHIKVLCDGYRFNLVYRPITNEVLIKIGNNAYTREVRIFEGF